MQQHPRPAKKPRPKTPRVATESELPEVRVVPPSEPIPQGEADRIRASVIDWIADVLREAGVR